jgi:hypothetical protein
MMNGGTGLQDYRGTEGYRTAGLQGCRGYGALHSASTYLSFNLIGTDKLIACATTIILWRNGSYGAAWTFQLLPVLAEFWNYVR